MTYTKEQFNSFLEAMVLANKRIKEENPSLLLVTLNGGLPIYDCLTIINPELDDSTRVVYFPASSTIMDCKTVTEHCFENLLSERIDHSDKPRKIVSVDEVVSGGSVSRLINAYESATRQIARKNLRGNDKPSKQNEINQEAKVMQGLMPYQIVGLKQPRPGVVMSHEYEEHVKQGYIFEIPVPKIITMDNTDIQIIEWDHPSTSGYHGDKFWPRVRGFNVKNSYLDFLRSVAAYIGINPDTVGPKNLERIRSDCAKYSKKPQKS